MPNLLPIAKRLLEANVPLNAIDGSVIYTEKGNCYVPGNSNKLIKVTDLLCGYADLLDLQTKNPALIKKAFLTDEGKLYYYRTSDNSYQIVGAPVMILGIACAGTTQATATPLTKDFNFIQGTGNAGVMLPVASYGKVVTVRNSTISPIKVYPAFGGTIESLSTNIPIELPSVGIMTFTGYSTTGWICSSNVASEWNRVINKPFTTTNQNYYVDTTNGNDSNSGFALGTALKTIQCAIDKIPEVVNHTITIVVSAGTYTENLVFSGFMGSGIITLSGGSSLALASNYILNGSHTAMASMNINIIGFKTNNITAWETAFSVNKSNMVFRYCKFDGVARAALAGSTGLSVSFSKVYVKECDFSNYVTTTYGYAVYGAILGDIMSENNTGSNNGNGLVAQTGSSISKYLTQPTATVMEASSAGGVIRG